MKTKTENILKAYLAACVPALTAACIVVISAGLLYGAEPKPVASFHSIEGKVQVKVNGAKDWEDADAGVLLYEDDLMKTEISSKAIIRFNSGHLVKLEALGTLHITKATAQGNGEEVGLSLEKGKTFLRVQKLTGTGSAFSVKTPTAIAAVRGTEFSVEVKDDGASVVSLLTGSVEVSGEKFETFVLEEEQWITVEPGREEEAAPEEAPEEVVAELKSDAEELGRVQEEIEGQPGQGPKSKGDDETKGKGKGLEDDKPGRDRGDAGEGAQAGEPDQEIGLTPDDNFIEETIDNVVNEVIQDEIIQNETETETPGKLDDYPPFPPDM